MPERKAVAPSLEMKKDLAWWQRFLLDFNGTSILWLQHTEMNTIIAMDALLTGLGGTCGDQFFQCDIPSEYAKSNIAIYALLAVLVAM